LWVVPIWLHGILKVTDCEKAPNKADSMESALVTSMDVIFSYREESGYYLEYDILFI